MDESTARLVLTIGLGSVISLVIMFYWDQLANLSKRIFPDPDKAFKAFAIFLILSIALIGAFVSIVKMFRVIDVMVK